MMIDILMERGGLNLAQRWGQDYYCHFPLVHFLNIPSLSDMKGIYFIMWIGKSLKKDQRKKFQGKIFQARWELHLGTSFDCPPYCFVARIGTC